MYLHPVSPTTLRYIALSSTGYSPSFLEFRRELRLPNDLVDSNEDEEHDVSDIQNMPSS